MYYIRKLRLLQKIIRMPLWKMHLLSDEVYSRDGFVTIHDVPFLRDEKFVQSYRASIEGTESVYIKPNSRFFRGHWESWDEIAWRSHITCWAAQQVRNIKGDFVECGVANGLLSKAICHYTNFQNQDRKFYLIDGWTPLRGSEIRYPAEFDGSWYEFAKSRFKEFPNVEFVKGMIPEVLDALKHIEKIAYLSIDMNDGDPELDAVEFFWDRISVGGIIYFDDYLWGYPKLQENISRFAERKNVELLHIPTGNSLLIKPPHR